ncbi:MAG: acyl-CoA dehydrogenase family protein [Acidobacteriota bacterium]|nr:acyl-CoA dehydrogenase family protein [Acidobacteriota bacterium]
MIDEKRSIPAPPTQGLFLGKLDEESVYPFPEQDPDEKEIADMTVAAFREWADDNLDSEKIDRDQEIPESVRRQLGELGLLGATVPEEYEGAGFGTTSYCRLVEEMCRRDASLSVFVGAHLSIGAKPLLLYGNPEQKARYLPGVATGRTLCAFALTEPGSGSDANAMRTTAEWDEAKGVFRINGNKIWITNGSYADLFSVFAKTRGSRGEGPGAFLVRRGQPGFTNGPSEHKLGIRGTATTELAFQDVEVAPEDVIGEIGEGFKIALETLETGRLSLGAGCTGGSKECLKMAVEHATERTQFRKTIISFGMIREKLARMAAHTYGSESAVYLTSGLIDRDRRTLPVEAGFCKVLGSETLWEAVNDTVQVVGGIGYMDEYPYQRYLRDARINLIFEGTNEILRLSGTLEALKEPSHRVTAQLKAEKAGLGAEGLEQAMGAIAGQPATVPGWVPGVLAAEGECFAAALTGFSAKVVDVLRRHRRRILGQQYTLRRLADGAIQLYAMLAVLSRVSTRVAAVGEERSARDILLARRFIEEAAVRVRHEVEAIETPRDAFDDQLAELLGEEGRYPAPLF